MNMKSGKKDSDTQLKRFFDDHAFPTGDAEWVARKVKNRLPEHRGSNVYDWVVGIALSLSSILLGILLCYNVDLFRIGNLSVENAVQAGLLLSISVLVCEQWIQWVRNL